MHRAVLLLFCLSLVGCAGIQSQYFSGKLPTRKISAYPDAQEQNGVRVAVRRFSAETVKSVVGFSPEEIGVVPVFLIIKNQSRGTIWFDKSAVFPPPVFAKKIYQENFREKAPSKWKPATYMGRPFVQNNNGITKFASLLFFPGVLPKIVSQNAIAAGWNRDFKRELFHKEFQEGPIPRGQTRRGLIYLPIEQEEALMELTLTGQGLPLYFEL